MVLSELEWDELRRHAREVVVRSRVVAVDVRVRSAARECLVALEACQRARADHSAADDLALTLSAGVLCPTPRIRRAVLMERNTRRRAEASEKALQEACAELTGAVIAA